MQVQTTPELDARAFPLLDLPHRLPLRTTRLPVETEAQAERSLWEQEEGLDLALGSGRRRNLQARELLM